MNVNVVDFQIHSTASDGVHTPLELVRMSKERGLQVIAITDHDTVDVVEEALKAGDELGVRVIPGIEMSVEEKGAHILGYGIDYKNPEFLLALEKAKIGRIGGAKKMVENLKGAGFIVEWEDVLREATGGVVARPHISKAVLNRPENKEKLGSISTVHDFIESYLTNESPYYVKRPHVSSKDAVAMIHKIGGVAVWSHPAIHFKASETAEANRGSTPVATGVEPLSQTDYGELENFLKELIRWGIDGVEVFNPSHTEDDVEFVQGLAVKYNLLRSAGSDFHEIDQQKKGVALEQGFVSLHSANTVGDYETYGFSTDDIVQRLNEAINKKREN